MDVIKKVFKNYSLQNDIKKIGKGDRNFIANTV